MFTEAFIEALLKVPATTGTFHPWISSSEDDASSTAPADRITRLRQHLSAPSVRLILCGEAAGYQGLRVSGCAFTSEALILEGAIPRISASQRLSVRDRPWSEPSARIVWKTLYAQNVAESTILWNAFPLHPQGPHALSNRAPTKSELLQGLPLLAMLRDQYPDALMVAVGLHAQASLKKIGIAADYVRHPAYGGATEFAAGIQEQLARPQR